MAMMNKKIEAFTLAQYLAKHEFSAKYLLSCSDIDGLSLKNLINNSDAELQSLWNNLHLGYTNPAGNDLVRQEILKLYKNVSLENIFQTSSSEESVFIILNCLLENNDHVVAVPGYQTYTAIPKSIGCEVSFWQPNKEWEWNIAELKKVVKPNTKLIAVNFPHNPTGANLSHETQKDLINFCEEKDIWLFSDEMFQMLELDKNDKLPAAADLSPKAISLSGLSKTLGLAGLRIGWSIIRDKELLQKAKELKDYTTICSSAPSEVLAIMALRNKNKIITQHKQQLQSNLEIFKSFLKKHSDKFECVLPKSGNICFPKILFNQTATSFCEKVVNESGIMLVPGQIFDFEDKYFRVGFGRKNFPEVLNKFDQFLNYS